MTIKFMGVLSHQTNLYFRYVWHVAIGLSVLAGIGRRF